MTSPWRMFWTIGCGVTAIMACGSAPVQADVVDQTAQGFVSRSVIVVTVTPAAVWKKLITPAGWWSGEHTFSGDAANLSLDPVPGGCFCEKLPDDAAGLAKPAKGAVAPRPALRGGVEHMRVVFADRGKALRMIGALGPLQSEAVNATLTVTIKPVEGGTRVLFEYVVGGFMRYPADKIATSVDTVIADQLLALGRSLGTAPARPAVSLPARPAPDRPSDTTRGGGLGRDGVLVPRGKVWSLPPSDGAATLIPAAPLPAAPAVENAPPASPALPVASLPQDTATAGGEGGRDAGPDATLAPARPEPRKSRKPAVKPVPKPILKPTTKPVPVDDQPSKTDVNSAFDAAFGGDPPPRPATQ